MARNAAGLKRAAQGDPRAARGVLGERERARQRRDNLNQALEKAGRVADFLEFAELLALDALERDESCGGHFREEHQTDDGEAKRNDEKFCHVSVWEFQGEGKAPVLHKEPLVVRGRAPGDPELQVTERR